MSEVCVLLTLLACSKGAAPPAEESFRRIQEREAQLDLGRAALERPVGCAEARAIAEDQVCVPSQSLCQLAQELDDGDARARCAAASDACRAARERAASVCATNAPAP